MDFRIDLQRLLKIPFFLSLLLFFLALHIRGADQERVIANRWGFIDKTGTLVIKFQFRQVGNFSEGLAAAQMEIDEKWGFIDRLGNFVIKPQFDHVTDFKEGLACVEVDHKFGYVDKAGNMVIPAIYVDARPFSEGRAEVFINKEGKSSALDKTIGYIDKIGTIVIQPKFWDMTPPLWGKPGLSAGTFSEGVAGLALDKDARGYHWGYIDRAGNVVLRFPNVTVVGPFSEGLAAVNQNGKVGFIDHKGQFVIPPTFGPAWIAMEHYFSEGLAAIEIGGKLGYIDRTGKVVIAPQFDWATDFSEGAVVAQIKDGDRFYVDKTGRRFFTAFGLQPNRFSEGLAAAPMKESLRQLGPDFIVGRALWGFINGKGEIVIPRQFDDAHSFSEGLAAVAKFTSRN